MNQFSLTEQAAWAPCPRHSMGEHISWLSLGSYSKPTAKIIILKNPIQLLPSQILLSLGTHHRPITNYADIEAFKNMLLIIQVPGQEPHTFTCGTNDLSFSWGPLLFFFLYFYFLAVLSFLWKRTEGGCLNIIKANYFSQNICLQE